MSLRRRLTLVSSLALIIAVAVYGIVAISRTRSVLKTRTSDELQTLTSGLTGPARSQLRRVRLGERPLEWKSYERAASTNSNAATASVVLADGTSLPLPNLAAPDRSLPTPPPDAFDQAGTGVFDVVAEDGTRFSAMVTRLPGQQAGVFVAMDDERTTQAVSELVTTFEITAVVLTLIFLTLIIVLITLAFRPLQRVTDAALEIAEGRSPTRVPNARPGTEVGDLTVALNEMLAKLQAMSDRSAQFASDAAHELRTPVTAILGYSELYRNGALSEPAALDRAFGRIDHETRRLADLVEGLLLLNRIETRVASAAGSADGTPSAVELFDIVALCADAAADSMAIDPGHPVEVDADHPVSISTTRDRVFQVVANLLANVRHHTPLGTSTVIKVSETEPDSAASSEVPARRSVVIQVTDDGPGLPEGFETRAFDRFTQADVGRTRLGGGSGLGLAIVRALVDEAGGTVELNNGINGGLVARVTWPDAPVS